METTTLEEKIVIKPSVNDVKDKYKMTKEELDAIVYEGIAQYERGECTKIRSKEDHDNFWKQFGV